MAERLPDFLYIENGRYFNGQLEEYEVTKEYNEYLKYLESVGKRPSRLPSFLCERDGEIYVCVLEDCDITQEWEDWVKSLIIVQANNPSQRFHHGHYHIG